ncbi:hypothetical protein [Absidia glauca]|uniref:Uncharacterized protein n=1 Tax=Absidia glauca TaxID=4829 RepID=A0A163J5R4_ABSGL|nr:hypothetical protein [Absidia glauca]
MTRPPFEFKLHPPSPRQPCTLPPVSSLLADVTTHAHLQQQQQCQHQHASPSPPQLPSPQHDYSSIPSIQLPEKEYPSLMLSIPYDPPSNSSSPTCSPLMSYQLLDTPQSSPGSSPHPFLLPPPDTFGRSRSLSNASTSSWSSVATSLAVTAPSSPIHSPERRLSDPSFMFPFSPSHDQLQLHQDQEPYQRHQSASPSLSSRQQLYPSVSTSSSSSSSATSATSATSADPVVKRRRGRPPNTNRQVQRDHWTFVTPTVWDVKHTQLPDHHLDSPPDSTYSPPLISSDSILSSSDSGATAASMDSKNGVMLVLWPHDDPNHTNGPGGGDKTDIHYNLNTFTSTRMDATLTMPKKKRGRKPKNQLAGNSCFVWRDLTARRGANRAKSPALPTKGSPKATGSTSTSTASSSSSDSSSSPSIRISKKSPSAPLHLHHPYSHPYLNRHRNKNEDDDIIDWTKDLSLNDRAALSN